MSDCSSSQSICPFSPSEHAHLCLNGSKMVLMFSNPEDAPFQPSLQSLVCGVTGLSEPPVSSEAIYNGSDNAEENILALVQSSEIVTNEKLVPVDANVKSSVFSLREALSRPISLILGAFKSAQSGNCPVVDTTQNSSDDTKSSSNRKLNYCVGSVLTNNDKAEQIKVKRRAKGSSRRKRSKNDSRGCSLYNLVIWAQSVLGFTTRGQERKKKMKRKNKKINANDWKSTSKNPRRNSNKRNQLIAVNSTTDDSEVHYCYFISCLGQEKLKKLLKRTKSEDKLDTVRYLTSQAPHVLSKAVKTANVMSREDMARLLVLYDDLTGNSKSCTL